MKFIHIFLILLVLISFALTKKVAKKSSKSSHFHVPSQYGRNYRKPRAEPSYNPLPKEYYTGPLTNFAHHTPKKYQGYNRFLSHRNKYLDTTGRNAQRGAGKPVSYALRKKN